MPGLGGILVELDGLGVGLIQRDDAAANAREMRLQAPLQVAQHAQGVEVHLFAGGIQPLLGFLHQMQGMRLSLLHDFFVANHLLGLLTRLLDNPFGLHLGGLRNLVALAHHATSFPNLLGNPNSHFIHNGQQGALVDHDLMGQWYALGVTQQRLQALNQVYEIDGDLPPPMGDGELCADGGCDVWRDEGLDRAAQRPDFSNE